MPGTGMMLPQIGQGNIGKQRIPMNGPNPAAESGLSTVLPKSELRTGAEIPLELAGQKPEVVAQQVEQIFKQEFQNFSEPELKGLVDVTMDTIQKIGLEPNTDLTLIAREIQSRTMLFTQEAAQLLTRALERMWEVLNSPDTSDNDSNNNFPGFGSTPTSSGSALAA
jgi:hypothetical protein